MSVLRALTRRAARDFIYKKGHNEAPKMRKVTAWASGPGTTHVRNDQTLKARNEMIVLPLQGKKHLWDDGSQGVALGYLIARLWRFDSTRCPRD